MSRSFNDEDDYIVFAVQRRMYAVASGEYEDWAIVELELSDDESDLVAEAAAKWGVDEEDYLTATVRRGADLALRYPDRGPTGWAKALSL